MALGVLTGNHVLSILIGVDRVEQLRSLGGIIISKLDNCVFAGLIYELLVFS